MNNQIAPSFNIVTDHLACPCCNAFEFKEKFWKRLQVLRDIMDKPFVTDKKGGGGYRCRIYNNQIGGAKNSRHLYGDAIDISTHGWSGEEKRFLVELAIQFEFSIGIYKSWFHLDLRPENPVLFWGD